MYAYMMPRSSCCWRSTTRASPRGKIGVVRLWPVGRAFASRSSASSDHHRRRRSSCSELDAVAERFADGRRHLCGGRFTAADLTFAASTPAVIPARVRRGAAARGRAARPDRGEVRELPQHPAGAFALELFRTIA